MRGLTRRWIWRQSPTPTDARGSAHDLIARILQVRGLCDAEQIARFCDPKLTHLHDPGLMPNIDAAAERIVHAVRSGQRVVIYGDYDVDGITATAILYHTIKAAQPDARISTYVPHRLEEGYGINCDALRQLRSDGADLVVSVDCGITAAASAATATEIGLDLIITDHHNLPADEANLPKALAVVHPRLPGSAYPFGDLCGAGVAFKLAWRFATVWCGSQRVSEVLQKTLLNMLPLAALGTIADVVPLVDENRIITSFGLRLIRQTPLAGLRALIEASDLAGENIDSEKVGFMLAPRLNACGRLGHADKAVHMLCDASPEQAMAIAQELTRVNSQRQRTERGILTQALAMAEDSGMTGDDCRAIVLADADWHPGVVGIVCSRLVDRFARPTVLMQSSGGICKGSGRSIDGYSIHAGLTACESLLSSFGGHEMAAGLTLTADKLRAFTEMFTEHANANIDADQLMPAVRIDCDASLRELDMTAVKRIAALSPFGRSNARPALRIEGAVVAEQPRQIGSMGKHLSLRLRQDDPAGRHEMRMVWWNAGELAGDLAVGMPLDAVIEPKINVWNGRTSVEAELRDVRVREAVAS